MRKAVIIMALALAVPLLVTGTAVAQYPPQPTTVAPPDVLGETEVRDTVQPSVDVAFTGSDVLRFAVLAAGLVTVGLGLVYATRRRIVHDRG